MVMQAHEIFDLLVATFGDAVFGFTEGGSVKDPFARVRPESLPEVAKTLRDHPALRFDFLENVTAVDYPDVPPVLPPTPEPPAEEGVSQPGPSDAGKTAAPQGSVEVVYHFFSYEHKHDFILKVSLPRENPRVPSLTSLWQSANWLEREQYDLLGVVFEGHPDLRRLLLPEDWVGHPLRKDYVPPSSYRGMSTERPNPLDMLPLGDEAAGPGGTP